MKDFVYYLEEDGEFIPELIFKSEEEAIEFAEANEMKNYRVIEWDVD
jgi:hypothetical protein